MHPRDAKMQLAYEVVSTFWGEEGAARGQEAFVSMFQKKDVPDEMPDVQLLPGQTLLDVLESAGLVESRGQGRRLLVQNGVKLDGEVIRDAFLVPGAGVLQVGKRKFVRLLAAK